MFRTLVVACSLAVLAAGAPGKLAVWSSRNNGRRRTLNGPAVKEASSYNTRTFEVDDIKQHVSDLVQDAEVVVFIKHAGQTFPNGVMDSIKEAQFLNVHPYVYHSSASMGKSNALESAVFSTPTFANVKTDLSGLNDENVFCNSHADAFVATLKGGEADAELFGKLSDISSRKKVVFVAVEEPTSVAPKRNAEYSRILNENDLVITEDQLYLPEGTEFTIFYAGEYLYLTPDIFTGLMTMIFMFFVGLIGFQCLGDIQGPACFPTKLPPLGREG